MSGRQESVVRIACIQMEPERRREGPMTSSLAQRRALLLAALGFMRLRWNEPTPSAMRALHSWMTSWTCLGAVVAGMNALAYDLELRQFPFGWRANFYDTGTAHSVVLGSAYEREPWTAVQEAAWDVLAKPWTA